MVTTSRRDDVSSGDMVPNNAIPVKANQMGQSGAGPDSDLDFGLNLNEEIETLFKATGPFRRVENGHGYYGVVLRDKTKDLIQCHVCGKWFTWLSHHVRVAHNLPVNDYREKCGNTQISLAMACSWCCWHTRPSPNVGN